MSFPSSEFIQIYINSVIKTLKIENNIRSETGVLQMPKALMEDLDIKNDDEVFCTFNDKIDQCPGDITNKFIVTPKYAKHTVKKILIFFFKNNFKIFQSMVELDIVIIFLELSDLKMDILCQ